MCKILRDAAQISSKVATQPHKKMYKQARCPQLEKTLLDWVDLANQREISVTRHMIKAVAAHVTAQTTEAPISYLNGWLSRFQRRYRIRSLQDFGEAGDCDLAQVMAGRIGCSDTTVSSDARDVCNLDDTALNDCASPKRSLQRRGSKRPKRVHSASGWLDMPT
ncbi:hypothetical protein PybrP1_005415 [[Pythium] brassicae (nom. inval.)]|nr:hypothetical protein PybrP1_005415 [[Pythium] brassicae (nom. inval.)]